MHRANGAHWPLRQHQHARLTASGRCAALRHKAPLSTIDHYESELHMNETLLLEGFRQLNDLAKAEYHSGIEQILAQPDSDRSRDQLGRLVGVLLKEPFAEATTLTTPSPRTGAYRSWHLQDEARFNAAASTWQYKMLDSLRQSNTQQRFESTYLLAQDAQYESGFFAYLARDLRRYICGDKVIRARVANAIRAGSALGTKLPNLTPEGIVGAGGLALGAYLVQVIPILGLAGAPVIAAIVVILYRIGVDAFCSWTDGIRTGDTEKH